MTTIVFVSDLNVYSKGLSRYQALERLGAGIKAIAHTPTGNLETGAATRSLLFRLCWKLGHQIDTEQTNRKILETVESARPDLLWIDKGNMVHRKTLIRARKIAPGIRIVSYSDDDMFAAHNHTRAYLSTLPEYDIVFTTKSYNADRGELPALGAKRTVMIDKYFDPKQHMPVKVTPTEKIDIGASVGFAGTYEEDRYQLMAYLAKNDVPVRIWGNGWGHINHAPPRLTVEDAALVNRPGNLLYTKGICTTDINLGFLRKANRDLQTDRSIEIPACGGFMLAERTDEHLRLFEEGREAEFFASPEEFLEKTRYYLTHPEERTAIARAGRERCLRDGYDIDTRMAFMMKTALA